MRGLQYQFFKENPADSHGQLSEVDDYPIIRTIRKNNGKFYIQILAGAFPYYHPLVHEPVLERLGYLNEFGLKWRNKICNKTSNWFNFVATTKWTCYVKHTEFSTELPEWRRTQTTKGIVSGIGGKPPAIKNPKETLLIQGRIPADNDI